MRVWVGGVGGGTSCALVLLLTCATLPFSEYRRYLESIEELRKSADAAVAAVQREAMLDAKRKNDEIVRARVGGLLVGACAD